MRRRRTRYPLGAGYHPGHPTEGNRVISADSGRLARFRGEQAVDRVKVVVQERANISLLGSNGCVLVS
jgi:hypothetical protein